MSIAIVLGTRPEIRKEDPKRKIRETEFMMLQWIGQKKDK
jgi:UDP-N-acetylglucosamine 2-epimerase